MATGSKRFIAKMHLNQLYGYFGRSLDLLETKLIPADLLEEYLATRVVKTIIKISPSKYVLLLYKNLNHDLIKKLNIQLESEFQQSFNKVKANIAIASAVTSYARIHMLPYKLDPFTIYTDTDSFFTTKKLDDRFVGNELGMMKNELHGLAKDDKFIEARFLGNKQYGYKFINLDGKTIEKSIIAGIKRDTVS
jgi:hypothetical protein